ncbi:uncharacterized protein UV8b_01481 [Ustilaginoidea virens]|uniref:Uncharacterized protein n=1 Tax=Ustilaginoidea virens TaxID=1159556 RepID=A0A063BXX9_USTVR|nr:uncharacterized protein UV8b_01481 [Ustilaginoidea virens]QUC17240.1 hypothetical protein UV8b_01481 [Ustilaginoidea virens]GAO16615.1 hypothetical protein UVI_02019470 [Ustilaginoidea virens]
MPRHDLYHLRFDLHQHFAAKVYTSGSAVTGQVSLCALRDIKFDDLEICLVGISTTQNFLHHESGAVAATFMKLVMPNLRRDFPPNRTFLAGREYSFPFRFIVPSHLAMGACRHKCASPVVREQHLRLPPTMGFWDGHDQSPQMTQVRYAVSVLATKQSLLEHLQTRVVEGSHMIRVLPAFSEDPPLEISPLDDRYALSKSKTIRKNFVASKLGRLTATTAQPKALMLSPDGHAAGGTLCRIKLAFESSGSHVLPPKINAISGKLVTHTYFDISSMTRLPNLGNCSACELPCPYQYTTSNKLFTLAMADCIDWKEEAYHASWEEFMFPSTVPPERRASAATCPEGVGNPKRLVSEIDVRFSLPEDSRVVYLPTFHSCHISRAYTLDLAISVGQTFTTLSLAVPLQIGVEAFHPLQRSAVPQLEAEVSFARGQDHGRRNTYAGWPGSMWESDNELPGYD